MEDSMRRTAVWCLFLLIFAAPVACGSGKYADAAAVLKDIVKAQERYLESLENISTAKDLEDALVSFIDVMEKLGPRLGEMREKYPELAKDGATPPELEKLRRRMEENARKFADPAENRGLVKFMEFFTDPGVQRALVRLERVGAAIDANE
jgi:hypothetical protein